MGLGGGRLPGGLEQGLGVAVVAHRRPYIGGLLSTGLGVDTGPGVKLSVSQRLRPLVVFRRSVVRMTGVSRCSLLYGGRVQLGGKPPVVCAALTWYAW